MCIVFQLLLEFVSRELAEWHTFCSTLIKFHVDWKFLGFCIVMLRGVSAKGGLERGGRGKVGLEWKTQRAVFAAEKE